MLDDDWSDKQCDLRDHPTLVSGDSEAGKENSEGAKPSRRQCQAIYSAKPCT